MSARLLLLRHGRTEWNASRRFQGQLDPPLDDIGIAQAAEVAPAIVALGPVALLCSDLQRAQATCAPIAALTGLEPNLDPRLREISLGDWQGLDLPQAREQFPEEYDAWSVGQDVRRGGGETYAEVGERAVASLDTALDEAGEGLVVAVTHGGTARAIVGTLLALPREQWSSLGPLGNCRLSLLVGSATGGWRLAEHNSGAPERRVPPPAG